MKARLLYLCALFGVIAGLAHAQPPSQSNPLDQNFFPPDLVMQHQEEVGLNEEQRTSIRSGMREAQQKFIDGQWKLESELEKMAALIRQPRVDEQKALAQLEGVLTIEREIKRAQIALMVHIKNTLTPEQQAKLRELRVRPRNK